MVASSRPPRGADPGSAAPAGPGLLDGLEMGLELAAAGRLAAVPLRRLNLRVGARLAGGGLRAVGRGAAAAALLEVPVALIEETLALHQGRKSPEQAARSAGAKVGAAALGGGIGAGVAYGLGAIGVGSLLAPIAPALLLAGGATVVLSTSLRLQAAFSAGPARPVLEPQPAPAFLDLEPGGVIQGTEVWMVPPAAAADDRSDRGEWGESAER